jgi:hypothetical protein
MRWARYFILLDDSRDLVKQELSSLDYWTCSPSFHYDEEIGQDDLIHKVVVF